MFTIRKYKNGDKVIVPGGFSMLVVDAYEALRGWRYTVAFTKKDGTPDKRYEKRMYFEDQLE